ncbi:MAG: hypothetical protein AB7T06_10475 [Kofleriaceae bacterium]
MSYASRLVQMSRPVAPARAPMAAPLAEVHEEVEAVADASPAEPGKTDAPVAARQRDRVETIERHVERERVVEERGAAVMTIVEAAEAPPPERARKVPAPWHAEDPAGDPLERVEAGDELRSLLRAVRAWTSEPAKPASEQAAAPIEITNVTTNVTNMEQRAVESPARVEPQVVERHEEATQVSIGNVMITVEDAPAPRGAPRAQAPRLGETASRLARHYLRGR